MTDLLKLAERCEGAEGPDRDIDLEIARMRGVTVMRRNYEDTANEEYTHWRYTTSIDAALTLVPDGYGLSVQRYWIARSDSPVWSTAIVTGGVPGTPRRVFEGFDTPNAALAICAAALKARSASDE